MEKQTTNFTTLQLIFNQCERDPAEKQQVAARLVAPMTTWTLNVSNRFITEGWSHFLLLILRIWTFAEPENAIQIELEFRRLTFPRLSSRITPDLPSTHSCRTQRVKQMGEKALARKRGPEETLATDIYSDVKRGTILSPNISKVIYFPSICSWMRRSVEWNPFLKFSIITRILKKNKCLEVENRA